MLNLTVKDKRKTLLFGSLDGGLGPKRYNGIGNLFSYHRAFKAFSVLSANNVGITRLEQSDDNVVGSSWVGASAGIQAFRQTARPFTRFLNTSLENLNNERVGTLNLAVSPRKTLKMSTNWTTFRDAVSSAQVQAYRSLGEKPFAYAQTDKLNQHPTLWQGQLQASYDWSEKTVLIYKGLAEGRTIRLDQQTLLTTANATQSIGQLANYERQEMKHLLELTHKLNANNAIVATLQTGTARLNEPLILQPAPLLPVALWGDSLRKARLLSQQTTQQNKWLAGQISWFYGTKKQKFEQHLGYSQTHYVATLLTDALVTGGTGIPEMPQSDRLQVNRNELYLRSKGTWTGGRFDLTGLLQASQWLAAIDRETSLRLVGQSNLSATYRAGNKSRFVVDYGAQNTPVQNRYLLDKYVLTDFRTAQVGTRQFLVDTRRQLSLSYLFTDLLLRKMTLFATVFTSRSNNFWTLADYLLLPEYTTVRLMNTPGISTNGANLLLEKLVYPLSGNIRMDVRLLQTEFSQNLNGQPQTTRSYIPVVTAKYVSVFSSPFNMELAGTYRYVNQVVNQQDWQIYQSFSRATGSTRLVYRTETIQVSTTADCQFINGNRYYFLKASVTNKFTSTLSGRLEGTNLFNQTTIRQISITPTLYGENNYLILPRMVLAYLQYSF